MRASFVIRHSFFASLVAVLFAILLPPSARALDDEVTDTVTVPAGSYIVDMGVTAQTYANGLKPYGMVYELVVTYRVPVLWSINSAKAKDGTDFTYNAKNYKGGPFIIRAEYVTTTVSNVIRNWKTLGVQVDGPITSAATSVPVYDTINSLAKLALDTGNGPIAAAYLANASIPASAYSYKLPTALDACDDIFVLPHADPTWSNHGNLVSFVQSGGYIWSACHAVSVLENLDDPGDAGTAPNMNFLSVNGLVLYGSHSDGSPPYTYNPSYDAAPVAQFMSILDSATQSGSEQIYLPTTGGWRPTTKVYTYDASQVDVPGLSPGQAAVVVYGRAFGNSSYGRVMYEAGHNHAASGTANVAAQRAFLNFYFLSGIDRRVEPSASLPAVMVERSATNISVSASGGSGSYTYQWSSSVGGTFGNSNAASTTYTPPDVVTNTTAVLSVAASDSCGRVTLYTTNITVQFVPTSDMSITVTDSQDPVAANGSFNYLLSVVNAGGDPATNLVVRDTLPPGATYASASGSGWSCNHSGGVVTCTRSTLSTNVGSPSIITIGVTATNIITTLTNTASVTSTNYDQALSNNTNSTTTAVINGIDLALTKSGSTNGYTGVPLPYTLTVTNKTPSAVTNVIITDNLPLNTIFDSASGSGWSIYYDAGLHRVTMVRSTLGSNASSVITLTVVPTTNAADTIITNSASVTSTSPDPDTSNNTSLNATTIIYAAADLSIVKGGDYDGGPSPDAYTFTIDLVNNGAATANSITVTDKLTYSVSPFPLFFSNAVASVGTYNAAGVRGSNGGSWTISSLAPGETATLTLYYGGNTTATFTNIAQIFSVTEYDPFPANNSDSAILDKDYKEIDFGVIKIDSADPVQAGSNVTYTITVTNTSTSVDWNGGGKTNTVVDVLPAGTTFVSASGTDWTCSHSSGVVTCFYTKDIGKHTAKSFTLVITAPSTPDTITNTVTMSYVRPNTGDPNPDNDSYSQTTTISGNVDLSVSQSVNNSTPDLYSNVTFTVTVSNIRSNAATNIRIAESLPSGLTYVSDSAMLGYYSSSDGYWYLGSLNVGESATLSLVAQAVTIGAKTNVATVSSLTQSDTNSANNAASAIVTPKYADLALAKSANTTTPSVNSNVTFTITVTNLGPNTASNITVSDALSEYLQYVSHAAGSGSYNSGTGVWSITSLASNATASLTLTAKVLNWGWLTNTATLSASSPTDPVSGNNSASVGVNGQLVDLDPGKTVDNERPLGLGSNLVFTIVVTNFGPSTASNVELTDLLPAGLGYKTHSPSQGSYTAGTGIWSVGTLASNAYATLTLTATNSALGKLTNNISITGVSQTITNISDDAPFVVIYSGGEADLYLTKSVDNATPYQGSVVNFMVTLINYGPDSATGVIIRDLLPSGLTYLSNSAPAGTTYTTNAGDWTVGTITNGQTLHLTISARAMQAGQIDNTAFIYASNASDHDPIGNSAVASIGVIPVADLIVLKTGATNVIAGSNLTYTITLTNAGLSSATNAILTDTLPPGAAFVSASGGGNHSSGVVTWPTLAVFTNTATTNVTVTITAPGSGILTNYAAASSSTTDTNAANNDGSAAASRVITPITPSANILTTKSGATNVTATSNLTYTITVTNLGPSTASNVIVSDLLPTNVTFVTASSGGTNGNGTVTWPTMTNFVIGFATNFTVTVTAPTSGPLTNVVSSTATTGDPDPSNNDGSSSNARVITTVSPIADVIITKSGAVTVHASSNLTYTITVTNMGPNIATNVLVSDLLPTNTTFVSASNGGTNGNGTVGWPAVTNFAVGATTNFTVIVTAPSSGSLTNIASSTATTPDPNASNNNGSAPGAKVVTAVTPVADLKVTKSGAGSVIAGSNLTYTITFTNLGPNNATNVLITDTLPPTATFVSASGGGSYSAGVVTWPPMTNVITTNFTITVTAPGSGPLTNSAAGSSSTFDPDASNSDGSMSNAKVITTVTPSADVATTKSGATSAAASTNIAYTINVTNLGPSTASNVLVSDALPAGVAFVSASGGGIESGGIVTWPTLTNFPYASHTNFTVTVTLPASGSVTNVVSSTSDTSDPVPANNNGTAASAKVKTDIVEALADIVTSVNGVLSALPNTNLTYTLTVANLGPGTASNVMVFDTLPAGVIFVSASSGGTNDNGVVRWPTMTKFVTTATTNFTVTVTAPDRGTLTNVVSSTSDTADPDASNNDGTSASGQVITLILGVNVTGYVYLDANKNGFKETSEAGTTLTLYAKIYPTTNAGGPALQATTADGTSGAYNLTNIYRGTYMVVIDNNNLLSDLTPTLPSGWTGTEMPAQFRTNVAVAFIALPNQNFGLTHSVGLIGKVFKDTGAGGGTANDGVANGAETGLNGVTVRLTDSAGTTVYDTAITDGSGNYTLLIPNGVANGATLKVTESNAPVHLSTGASVGDTGGAYDRASDTVSFTYTTGASYGGVNFGDVPENSFVNDSQQAALPGSFVVHPHSFTAGSGGSLAFSVASLPNPGINGWSQVIYHDLNCNGQIDSGEPIVAAAITVAAGDKVCILVKDFVPLIATFNSQDQLTVTAAFTWTGASPALNTNTTRIDLTIAGHPTTAGLTLLKSVDKETALPGEVLAYTVTYANRSSAPLTNIVIFDQTPAFTTFTSAGHGALPNNVSGIAVSTPAVAASGPIRWTFTGSLAPASSGTVTFSVTVAQ